MHSFYARTGPIRPEFSADYRRKPTTTSDGFSWRILIEQFSLIDLFLDSYFFVTQSRHDGFDVFRLNFGCAEQFVELIEGYEARLAAHFDGSIRL
jgi:hypothetical protein